MPFLIQPPLHYPPSHPFHHTYTILSPDDADYHLLQDLHDWDWHITWLEFSDQEFLDALVCEKREKRRGGEGKLTLDEVWEVEGRIRIEGMVRLWSVGEEGEVWDGGKHGIVTIEGRDEELPLESALDALEEEGERGEDGQREERYNANVVDRPGHARRCHMRRLTLEQMRGRRKQIEIYDGTMRLSTREEEAYQEDKRSDDIAKTDHEPGEHARPAEGEEEATQESEDALMWKDIRKEELQDVAISESISMAVHVHEPQPTLLHIRGKQSMNQYNATMEMLESTAPWMTLSEVEEMKRESEMYVSPPFPTLLILSLTHALRHSEHGSNTQTARAKQMAYSTTPTQKTSIRDW